MSSTKTGNKIQHANVDFIIIGQGLAGTLLAFALLKNNASVIVIDPHEADTSSNIAAGIIHPISGRRIVKTWKADTLIPAAFKIYHELQQLTCVDFFHHSSLIEIYQSIHHRNDWMARSSDFAMQPYIGDEINAKDFPGNVTAPFGGIYIKQSGWLDVKKFIDAGRTYFQNMNCLVKGSINENEIVFENHLVKWRSHSARHLIFCNGSGGHESVFFSQLPFLLSKGEILEIESSQLKIEYILNKGVFILPTGNNKFKVGSTFTWQDLDHLPTQRGENYLTEELKKITNAHYKIIDHRAAVRPTTKDRRPMIGLLQKNSMVGIFNGMGTKGVSIAPYYAEQFAKHLMNIEPLDDEVSIARFNL